MIYETVLEFIVITFVVMSILRLVAQGLFSAVKLDESFLPNVIPGLSSYRFFKKHGAKREYILGTILRVGGAILMIAVLFWQYYQNLVQLTHMYGLLFKTYEPVDYSVVWSILSYTGVIMILAGVVLRYFAAQHVAPFFNASKWMSVVCAIEPAFYYVCMAASKKVLYVMMKNPKYMSSEEYQMFCVLSESDE
jgi:hypothetical protein